MTYVPGGTLERYWALLRRQSHARSNRSSRSPSRRAAASEVAHGNSPPIVHRDIKPQNLLVGFDEVGVHVRLSDFGLAKRVNPLTLLVTSPRGTLGFKPPEAFLTGEGPSTDIWALGTTMYLLLTDRMPFPALDERDISDARHFLRPMRPLGIYNIRVDQALESIVYRCLATEPRGPTTRDAADLLADLDRWSPGNGGQAGLMSQSVSGKPAAAEGLEALVRHRARHAPSGRAVALSANPINARSGCGPARGSHGPRTRPSATSTTVG